MVGAVAHPFAGNDIYAYYGQEQTSQRLDDRRDAGWLGNGAFPESCGVQTAPPWRPRPAHRNQFQRLSALCSANVKRVQEFTIGFWQDIYKGDLGQARWAYSMNS